jgi:hypothetical protein
VWTSNIARSVLKGHHVLSKRRGPLTQWHSVTNHYTESLVRPLCEHQISQEMYLRGTTFFRNVGIHWLIVTASRTARLNLQQHHCVNLKYRKKCTLGLPRSFETSGAIISVNNITSQKTRIFFGKDGCFCAVWEQKAGICYAYQIINSVHGSRNAVPPIPKPA